MLKRPKQGGSSGTLCPATATSQSFPFFLSASASPDRHLFASLRASLFLFFSVLLCIQGVMPANPMPLCQQRRMSWAHRRHWPEAREQGKRDPLPVPAFGGPLWEWLAALHGSFLARDPALALMPPLAFSPPAIKVVATPHCCSSLACFNVSYVAFKLFLHLCN